MQTIGDKCNACGIHRQVRLISSGVTANRRVRMYFKMNFALQVKIMTYIVGLFTENFICS